jgi:hypothetical protein
MNIFYRLYRPIVYKLTIYALDLSLRQFSFQRFECGPIVIVLSDGESSSDTEYRPIVVVPDPIG